MPLELPELSDIQQLCSNVVIVSELPEIISSNIEETDVFTFARESSPLCLNYNIQRQYFDSQMAKLLFNDNLNIVGKWEYGIKDGSQLCIDTESVISGPNDTIVNKEYFENVILKAIDDLSNYIYNQQHVPSYVGDIIFSLILDTEEKVKLHYGGIHWELLSSNIMILGVGKCDENNMTKFGNLSANEFEGVYNGNAIKGSNTAKLTENQIPRHNHKFVGNSTSHEFSWNYRGSNTEKAATGVIEENDWGYQNEPCYKAILKDLGGTVKITGKTTISSSKVYGNSLQLNNAIYDSSGNLESYEDHNNVPPVIIAYIWQRVD